MTEHTLKVIALMRTQGGRFVSCLAETYMYADNTNREKIEQTWPELFTRYAAMLQAKEGEE